MIRTIVVFLLVLGIGYVLYNQFFRPTATISGNVIFNSLEPEKNDRGIIRILSKKYNSTEEYRDTGLMVDLVDHAPWRWEKAAEGQPYVLVAKLTIDGKDIKTSDPLIVTAPADNQQLNLRITWKDLPPEVTKNQVGTITGKVIVNGYIPSEASLTINARANGEKDFSTIHTFSHIAPSQTWEWTEAIPLKRYQIKATLGVGDNYYEDSSLMVAEAADEDIDFTINSEAKPSPSPTPAIEQIVVTATPAPTKPPVGAKISGKIYVNGPEDKNSSLLISWSEPGKNDFNEIQRINNPNNDGQYWEFTKAVVGKEYKISVGLQINNNNAGTARSTIVAAPASEVNFTINTGISVPKPNNLAYKKDICTSTDAGRYDVNIGIPKEAKAGNYWLQVGTDRNGSNVYNSKFKTQNDNREDQVVKFGVDQSKKYYVRYAYSLCSDCNADQNFSDFSGTSEFSCN